MSRRCHPLLGQFLTKMIGMKLMKMIFSWVKMLWTHLMCLCNRSRLLKNWRKLTSKKMKFQTILVWKMRFKKSLSFNFKLSLCRINPYLIQIRKRSKNLNKFSSRSISKPTLVRICLSLEVSQSLEIGASLSQKWLGAQAISGLTL